MQYTIIKSNDKIYELQNPFINASGVMCRTEEELNQLVESSFGSLITKTCTSNHRQGNPEPRYYDNKQLSINSMGLPNMGLDFYLDYYSKIKDCKKLKFISIGGLSLNENIEMLLSIMKKHYIGVVNIDAIEINFSCPNIVGHPQLGYDFESMDSYLETLMDIIVNFEKGTGLLDKLLIGLKLPPYFDMVHFETVANIIKKYPRINFLTCINSIGNGLVIDTESESVVIKPKNGFGGIGGSIVKPTALANVNKFYQLLGDRLFIIGCGGITTGEDAFHHLLAGASMLSVGTAVARDGLSTFKKIEKELEEIIKKKDYKSISDIIGKLKVL